ncbi:MAG: CopG family antitoxin [bacterium]
MSKGRSTISKAKSYKEAGEFWDTQDLGELWDRTQPVEIEVDLDSERFLFPVESRLAREIEAIARSRGVSTETLVNLWLREKVAAGAP